MASALNPLGWVPEIIVGGAKQSLCKGLSTPALILKDRFVHLGGKVSSRGKTRGRAAKIPVGRKPMVM